MKKIRFFTFALCCCITSSINAQNSGADFMQSIGKIYVVVAVIITIFLGIILYLIALERKIKRLENQVED